MHQWNITGINNMINYLNHFRLKKASLAILALSFLFLQSCKKTTLEYIQDNENETIAASSNHDIYRGNAPPQHDSIGTVMHFTPSCITSMMQDPEFSGWDFDNMIHYHEYDTIGFYTYIIPYEVFSNCMFLCVGVNDDTIVMRFALLLPSDFDYQTYYSQNKTAFVSAWSYNYEEDFFNGTLDVRNNTFTFNYVNPDMFHDDPQKLPPVWKWKDMNPCQRFFTGFQIAWDIPTYSMGLLGIAARQINGFTMKMIREHACL